MKPGDRFGRLTVMAVGRGRRTASAGWTGRLAVCACNCGSVIEVRAVELRRQGSHGRRGCLGEHVCSQCGDMMTPHEESWHMRRHVRAVAA